MEERTFRRMVFVFIAFQLIINVAIVILWYTQLDLNHRMMDVMQGIINLLTQKV